MWTQASTASDVRVEWGTAGNASIKGLPVLPWQGISKIDIVFPQDVTVSQGDLTLTGNSLGAVSFNPALLCNSATHTATWPLTTPIGTNNGSPYGIDTPIP